MRKPIAISLLLLAGCPASVTLEDADEFGLPLSAVWFHWEGDSEYDNIVVSNQMGLCGATQEWAAAYNEVSELYDDSEGDDFCEDGEAAMGRWVSASHALFQEGMHRFEFVVQSGPGKSEPYDETYRVDRNPQFSGWLYYYNDSPYEGAMEDWDRDGDPDESCGLDIDLDKAPYDYFFLSEGELELDNVVDEGSLTGALEGELVDEDGDDEGDVEMSFTASYCEVELEDR